MVNTRNTEETVDEIELENLNANRQELLETARQLNHMGKQFERFMSLQLQQLEIAIDDFQRDREAWRRQRDREIHELKHRQSSISSENEMSLESSESDYQFDNLENDSSQSVENFQSFSKTTTPLRMIIDPGNATAMQVGLLLFEISKLNREFGGSGIRFDVSTTKMVKGRRVTDEGASHSLIGLEAFSFAPLLAYDGTPTHQLQLWNQFKSQILKSSLVDLKLHKEFSKTIDAPRDDETRSMAFEATRRAENANTKCDTSGEIINRGFYSGRKVKIPANQQIQRVEDVARFLKKECELRIHLALVW